MPINRPSPEQVRAALTADEFWVTGLSIFERDSDGNALTTPNITIYWVKRLAGVPVEKGSTVVPSAAYRGLKPDGRLTWFDNIKTLA